MSVDMATFNWDSIAPRVGVTADPAAGANPAEITCVGRVLLLGVYCELVTDGTAANRYSRIAIKHDGTNIDSFETNPTAHTASLTRQHMFIAGMTAVFTGTSDFTAPLPIPGMEIPAGGKWQMTFVGIVAGDNAGVCRYFYKEAPA